MAERRHLLVASLLSACTAGGPADPQASMDEPTDVAMTTDAMVECLFVRGEEGWLSIDLATGCAIDPAGRFVVASSAGILEAGAWASPLGGVSAAPDSFAIDAEGALLVVSGSSLVRFRRDGTRDSVTELPAPGFRVVSGDGERAYLYGPVRPDATAICVLEGSDSVPMTVQQVGNVDAPISAAVTIGDDLLFAAGCDLFRLGRQREDEWLLLRIARVPCDAITSLAFDGERTALYVASTTSTHLFRGGVFAPLLAFGGELALGGAEKDQLYVYQPVEGRAFKVDLPRLCIELSTDS